jgi:hypothetical protein
MPTRTWRGTTNSNWGTNTNWLEGAVPTAADDVVFDATSPNCTTNVTGLALTITFTNYTATITFTNTITVSGNVTLGASMTFAGSAALIINANSTITANGKPLGVPFTCITVGRTINIADALTFNGNVTLIASAASPSTIKSSSSGVKRTFTLSQSYTQDIDYINFTDLNALSGVTWWSYKGTITNCDNIFVMPTQPGTISKSF